LHIFIGAPGAGKTTALCKWLAQVSLVEGRSAAVWRLDGHVANTAESLSVFGEILGVPGERCAPANDEVPDADVLFVDLPGVNPSDAAALGQLKRRLAAFPNAQVHLVVNAAYETSLLLAQVRAFSALPIQDVIVTHLDEESRWGKLWNLVLGTNCAVRYLAAGQNVPGEFIPATPEQLFSHQFPRKSGVFAQ
jgi:flagellar biosynthesis protein FlhF